MPTYDFRCKSCENKFTTRISIADRDKVRCPKCNGSMLQQIFTPVSVTVKGESGHSCDQSCGAGSKFG